jgi:hypothetical protein
MKRTSALKGAWKDYKKEAFRRSMKSAFEETIKRHRNGRSHYSETARSYFALFSFYSEREGESLSVL